MSWFRKKGINELFEWQVECLCKNDVLSGGNLVYSAPTSAGKTLVADILLLKKVLEHGKKALLIEPFVALTREKASSLKSMLFNTKARVGAFGGSYYTPGGLAAVSVAVCTIEKANNFINKLINEEKLSDLGIIVVDEIHFLGDERRGHQLELLLTKVLYYNSKHDAMKHIQIVGLSATIPNLATIASWLRATLYITEYRPVPLIEKIKLGPNLYEVRSFIENPACEPLETVNQAKYAIEKDYDDLFYLCIDAIVNGHSALVFCESKRECEIMASNLSSQIQISGTKLNSDNQEHVWMSNKLRENLSAVKLRDVLSKLKKCPAGSDTELVKSLRFGIAFHHAGLTSEEREIIEDGFKGGAIKTLMATSTLSSGVNLPARKVIIRSPTMISNNSGTYQKEMLNPITYRQMIGRAGRKNIDTTGESILICRPETQELAITLIKTSLGDISSSLGHRLIASEGEPSGLKKAVLEVIANGTAITLANLNKYLQSTFWLSSSSEVLQEKTFKNAIEETIRFLIKRKFIEELKPGFYKPTRLGNAVLVSGIHPDESLELVQDLTRARQGFILTNDLHIIYQVTPSDIARTIELKDWLHYSKVWNDLDETCRSVGERVGIDDIVVGRRAQGFMSTLSDERERIYKRFWAALVINDLVSEMQLPEICQKYRMSKAVVQQAQRTVAQYAGVVSIFCEALGYANLAALVMPLESRINFSCQRDLVELIRLNITRPVARCLYDNGYKNTIALAKADKLDIEFAIRQQLHPFKKDQSFRVGSDSPFVWVPELAKNMTTLDYASHIVDTARNYVEVEYDINVDAIISTRRDLPQPSPSKRSRVDDGMVQTTIT